MTDEKKKIEIVFAPGCFDSFDGTQEELDEMVAEIQRMADSGEMFEKSTPVNIEDFIDNLSPEEIEDLIAELSEQGDPIPKRTLQ